MKFRKRTLLLGAAMAALAGFAVASRPVPTFVNPLRVSLVGDSASDFLGTVQVRLTNTSNRALRVPSWQTPIAGISSDLFAVYRDGERVEYLGAMIKRGPLTSADFITLAAGETRLVNVDLTQFYDMSESGQYNISFRSYLQGARTDDNRVLSDARGRMPVLQSAPLSLRLDADSALNALKNQLDQIAARKPPGGSTCVGNTCYESCSSTQQSQINTALNSARTYSENSRGYLAGGTVGPRYTTWFGAYTSARYATARDHFNAIDSALDTQKITINCGCNQSYYAYVYPNQPYRIYVCRAFWNAPNTGTDSRAGTLIHEMSHFDVVANTDDVVYGQTGAKNLAASNPDDALRNADNHEYFAENTPFQN
jgi:peptidyl-Lys metalloendopeptidase